MSKPVQTVRVRSRQSDCLLSFFMPSFILTHVFGTRAGIVSYRDVTVLAVVCALCQPWMQALKLHTVDTPVYSYLTAHFVHINWMHFALDMACMALIPVLLPHISRTLFWFSSVLMSLGISLVLLRCGQLEAAHVSSYVGFSGVLHGLYVLLSGMVLVQRLFQGIGLSRFLEDAVLKKPTAPATASKNNAWLKDYFFWQSAVLFFGTFVKVALESLTQPTHAEQLIGAPVVFAAHTDGAVFGLLILFIYALWVYGARRSHRSKAG